MRRLLYSFIALGAAACSTQQCKDMKGSGSVFGSLFCGGEGTEAPEPLDAGVAESPCEPSKVMPTFFALINSNDSSLAGLRAAMGDLGAPRCVDDKVCTSDSDCITGACSVVNAPLSDVVGLTLKGLAAIATDPAEPGAIAPSACVTPELAKNLTAAQRNRMCELARSLQILLEQNGGSNLVNDPNVKKVLVTLLSYAQGGVDGKTHYDLFTGIGRLAGSNGVAHNDIPYAAALWQLLDNMLGYLTPEVATNLLGHLQILLQDPEMKTLLGQLSAGGSSAQGRDSVIVLLNTFAPGFYGAADGKAALDVVHNQILTPFVYNSSSLSDAFKAEVQNVETDLYAMMGDSKHPTGIYPPLAALLEAASTPEVRCADASNCDPSHDNELVGALYDILSRPENTVGGGLDLSTLVGALKKLATLDSTGQTSRTIRLIVQGVEGSADPNDSHEARDALAALAKDALTAKEGAKLVPALSVIIDKQVVGEIFSLLQDLLYTCKPPPTSTP